MKTTQETDALFTLPLEEFTAARNALAGKLRKSGDAEEADRVKAFQKPPVSAWVVNQLFWQHQKAFERLIASGERFRTAQAAQLAGKRADLRGPLDAKREALGELTRLAGTVLDASGHAATPDTTRRITTTLEAFASYGSEAPDLLAGRLTDDLQPPGFETFAALVPRAGRAREAREGSRVIPFQHAAATPAHAKKKGTPKEEEQRREQEHAAEIAAARTAVQGAERALADARKAAARAQAAMKGVAAKARETEKLKADLEKRFERASADADAARQAARKTAGEAEDAAQAVDDAERALAQSRGRLAELT